MVVSLNIAVIGCGHVGSVVSTSLANAGHQVVGFDASAALVRTLRTGKTPFFEPRLEELLQRALLSDTIRFDDDERCLDGADVFVVCVDTPLTDVGVSIVNLTRATEAVARSLKRTWSNAPVILKSTTPLGTAANLNKAMEQLTGFKVEVAVVPEFLREGSAVANFAAPDRVVIGSSSERVRELARTLFAPAAIRTIETDMTTAELIKHGANAFLAARISLVNELADIASAFGCDIDTTVIGIGSDERIGKQYLAPGIGFGGSCLPRDVAALVSSAHSRNVESPMLAAVLETNTRRVQVAVELLRHHLGALDKLSLAVWGLTFKGNTADTRNSPAVAVIEALTAQGALITAYDPTSLAAHSGRPNVSMVGSPLQCCVGADALLILTDWPEFAEIDLHEVRGVMNGRLVLDGRNVLEPLKVTAAGLKYQGIGRTPISEHDVEA